MKTFLLVNENGSDNIGDHAINEGLKALLSELGCSYSSEPYSTTHVDLSVESRNNNNQGSASLMSRLRKSLLQFKPLYLLMWLLKHKGRIKQCCEVKYDGIIIGGGQLILSGAAFPPALYAWSHYAKKSGTPLYLLGVGCGEHFHKSESWLVRRALKLSNRICVRENESITKLSTYFNAKAEFCPDLAFGLQPLKSSAKRSGLMVGMTDYAVFQRYRHEVKAPTINNYQEYLTAWYDKVMSVHVSGEPIVLASTTLTDAQCNRDLYQLLLNSPASNDVRLIDGVLPLDKYRQELSQVRSVFSGRMHSLILGKIEGATIEPWIISKKIENFLGLYAHKDPAVLKQQLQVIASEIGA
ncbi:polysaccharide pyruvyl transferase family protein [Pseudoalteromonas sp. MMG022]|uniref:polysaccharide pyruvyl transferase family protein n=1 Tax=Pseudoalteromonas sp. MMG022 TaxID=2909978 RepID=UPI001F3F6AAF|nr:polysaccharide pyruvyl transferase family protein [Pseudoalteromonas sp. MMG022]MCF6436779.1 polysaccharide pyruvyl transferase family protein [Pseudoalteromonas sp. MMG022]